MLLVAIPPSDPFTRRMVVLRRLLRVTGWCLPVYNRRGLPQIPLHTIRTPASPPAPAYLPHIPHRTILTCPPYLDSHYPPLCIRRDSLALRVHTHIHLLVLHCACGLPLPHCKPFGNFTAFAPAAPSRRLLCTLTTCVLWCAPPACPLRGLDTHHYRILPHSIPCRTFR